MMLTKIISILVMMVCQYLRSTTGESTIRAVSLLFRHGDRSPLGGYPNDPYANYPWPGGYGALSPEGIQQLHKSGVLKAKRYASLLKFTTNNLFDFTKVYMQSSSTQRCIDSAISFLEGFIPTKWPPNLINVLPEFEDEILAIAPGKPCPKYDLAFRNTFMRNDPEVENLVGNEEEFTSFLAEKTGLNATALRRFYYISDSFKVQLDNGLEIPEWAQPIYESHLKPLGKIIFNKWGHTPRMKVRSGALLKDMLDRLDRFVKGGNYNIYLYSGHDLTISSLMIHLDILEQGDIQPDYGATLAIELHENEQLKDYEVKVYYFRNFLDENPVRIQLAGCEEPCAFGTFKTVLHPKLTLNYEEVCKL